MRRLSDAFSDKLSERSRLKARRAVLARRLLHALAVSYLLPRARAGVGVRS